MRGRHQRPREWASVGAFACSFGRERRGSCDPFSGLRPDVPRVCGAPDSPQCSRGHEFAVAPKRLVQRDRSDGRLGSSVRPCPKGGKTIVIQARARGVNLDGVSSIPGPGSSRPVHVSPIASGGPSSGRRTNSEPLPPEQRSYAFARGWSPRAKSRRDAPASWRPPARRASSRPPRWVPVELGRAARRSSSSASSSTSSRRKAR